MSTPVLLSGTIPGLRRVGSVVIWDGEQAVVTHVGEDYTLWRIGLCATTESAKTTDVNLDLDLSDPTSRVHAAWWVCGQGGGISEEEHTILIMARNGVNINTQGQEQLRDMVLRRVKASPSPDKQPGADGIPLDQEKR